ncbi:hypothetical protein Tco_0952353 [Tanacetum coccineum]|uniref:Uncharacterized protein n=1 Tax=Tanacetum coccineum TaxID=301880 RepID=A0ABQ5DYL1_9ASTR
MSLYSQLEGTGSSVGTAEGSAGARSSSPPSSSLMPSQQHHHDCHHQILNIRIVSIHWQDSTHQGSSLRLRHPQIEADPSFGPSYSSSEASLESLWLGLIRTDV